MQNLMQVEDQEHKIVKEEKYFEYMQTLEQDYKQDLSERFFYLSCETSNNSHFEIATVKNLGSSASTEFAKLDTILGSSNIR